MTNLLMVVLLMAALFLLMGGGAAGSPTGPVNGGSGADCVAAYRQQYAPGWAEMSKIDRVIVGLRASACEGGR